MREGVNDPESIARGAQERESERVLRLAAQKLLKILTKQRTSEAGE